MFVSIPPQQPRRSILVCKLTETNTYSCWRSLELHGSKSTKMHLAPKHTWIWFEITNSGVSKLWEIDSQGTHVLKIMEWVSSSGIAKWAHLSQKKVERRNADSFGIKADQVVHSQVQWQLFTVVSLSKLTAEGGFQISAMQWKLKVTHVWSDAPRSTDCNLSQQGPFVMILNHHYSYFINLNCIYTYMWRQSKHLRTPDDSHSTCYWSKEGKRIKTLQKAY